MKRVQYSLYVQRFAHKTGVIPCVLHSGASRLLSIKATLRVTSMLHEYHIFEMFPDGSSLWRARIAGRFNTQRKLQELAEHSESEFVALDFSTSHFLWSRAQASKSRPKIENLRSIDTVKAGAVPASAGPRAPVAKAQSERRSHGS
jgi:hypothetical protein